MEQPCSVHPRKLDHEIFEDGPSAKIGSLENFRLYGIVVGNNVPDPNDTDDEMEAGGTSGVPSQGGDLALYSTDTYNNFD